MPRYGTWHYNKGDDVRIRYLPDGRIKITARPANSDRQQKPKSVESKATERD